MALQTLGGTEIRSGPPDGTKPPGMKSPGAKSWRMVLLSHPQIGVWRVL